MNINAILDDTVRMIHEIPEKLSGDDSPLTDPWEEIITDADCLDGVRINDPLNLLAVYESTVEV